MRALLLAAITAVAGTALAGCDDYSQAPQAPQCPGGATPTSIQAQPNYVVENCPTGSPIIVKVSDYNSTYGSGYSGGQDMLHDPFFWAYMMGPSYQSYPVYHTYVTTPVYRSYQPSSYVRSNIQTVRSSGLAAGYKQYTTTISKSYYNSSAYKSSPSYQAAQSKYSSGYSSSSRGYTSSVRSGKY